MLSLRTAGARRLVARWRILPLMSRSLAKKMRLNPRLRSVSPLVSLLAIMVMHLGLKALLTTRPMTVLARGEQVSGPTTMAPLVVTVLVRGLRARRKGQPYGSTTRAPLQGGGRPQSRERNRVNGARMAPWWVKCPVRPTTQSTLASMSLSLYTKFLQRSPLRLVPRVLPTLARRPPMVVQSRPSPLTWFPIGTAVLSPQNPSRPLRTVVTLRLATDPS